MVGGVFVQGGFCPPNSREILKCIFQSLKGGFVHVNLKEDFVQGGFCPGGFCPRGILSRGILSYNRHRIGLN